MRQRICVVACARLARRIVPRPSRPIRWRSESYIDIRHPTSDMRLDGRYGGSAPQSKSTEEKGTADLGTWPPRLGYF